jgi:transposase-like protein
MEREKIERWKLSPYECKACRYHYTVAKKSDVKSIETGRMALGLYLEGLGFRVIGRMLKIS